MAYTINSPNSNADYQIDQYRLNRLGGSQQDYQLAQIANEHPDWTPAQVRMAASGQLAGAPSTRLLTGFGLPPRYRITGNDFDPGAQPGVEPSNKRFTATVNSLQNTFLRQQNAFRLGQISKAQAQLDKLDPDADNYDTRKSELTRRIDAFTEEGQNPAPPVAQPAVPLGEGTQGEEAPVYQPGGPAATVHLSNGGNIYFGPAGGAPAFTTHRPQAPPVATTTQNSDANPGNYFPGTPQPFTIPGPITFGSDAGNSDAVPTPVVVNLSPGQIKKRIAIQKQIRDDATPDYIKNALTTKAMAIDSRATNAPAPFAIGPTTASPDPSGSPKISNQADYDALPNGAQYTDPNGMLRTKSSQ